MHWLVDGHNLIGQMPGLRLDDPNDEEKLLEQLRRYRARTGHRITVIFDSGAVYQPGSTKKMGGITVTFAPPGKTADQLIKQRVRRVKNPQAVMVVTSDRAVQQAASQAGVRTLSAGEFASQLQGGSGATSGADPGAKSDVRLSADEIDEWLDIFGGT
jgi:predicted RNA-binding protein with PIN domain